jgi:glycerate kinase
VRVLAAPDKFRGTLTAAEAAAAIASGWRRARPEDEVDELPMADGGEGTLETLATALGGRILTERVTGPLGDPVNAAYGVVEADGMGIVEMAGASGLGVLPRGRREPLRATTRGTGELILAACRHEVRRVVVCIGGSATTDGGAGMAQALGIRLLDREGRDIGPGGMALLDLDRIDTSDLAREVRGVEFVVACDVDNPLTGPQGAAAVYGPQKGATPADVEVLDRALARFAEVALRDLGVDVRDAPGAGAAGGLGAGMIAFLGAALRPGVDVVMEAVRFDDHLREAGIVVTGEGKLDEQSLHGKTPAGVLRAARARRIPVAIVCGQAAVGVDGVRVLSLIERFGKARAFGDARAALEDLAAELAGEVGAT